MSQKASRLLYQNLPFSIRHAQSNSLLPFLYQTQTLQLASRAHKNLPRNHCRTFRSSSTQAALEDIPFEDTDDFPIQGVNPEDADISSSRLRDSTITASEREVFDRIFNDIAKSSSDQGTSNANSLDDNLGLAIDPDEDLSSIFNRAIKASQARKTISLQSRGTNKNNNNKIKPPRAYSLAIDPSRFPPPLREAAAKANTVITSQQTEKDPQLGFRRITLPVVHQQRQRRRIENLFDAALEKARSEDKLRVEKLLDSAQTDVELWGVLEKEVFSRVEEMNEQMEEEERRKVELEDAKSKPKARRRGTKNQVAPATEPESPVIKILPLNILQTNYAFHCIHAQRIFRTNFPTSPYAMHLIPTIKRLGPLSYVLGASVELYNELVYLRWVHYNDLHGVVKLVNEMLDQGIGTDGNTKAVMVDVERQKRKEKSGRAGEVMKAWWSLQGQKDALGKLYLVWQRSNIEHKEVARRREMEERDAREEGSYGDGSEDAETEAAERLGSSPVTHVPLYRKYTAPRLDIIS
ncbi:hypothetical protein MMC24_001784 [Lignoscripta atroalba]|nr:hypothetical protein [Lignoscripta atroalba]